MMMMTMTVTMTTKMRKRRRGDYDYKYDYDYYYRLLLFLLDTLCDPPCLHGQFCDEISGKCICNDTRRDVQRCYESAGIVHLFHYRKAPKETSTPSPRKKVTPQK